MTAPAKASTNLDALLGAMPSRQDAREYRRAMTEHARRAEATCAVLDDLEERNRRRLEEVLVDASN